MASSASAARSCSPSICILDGDEVGDGVLVPPTPVNEGVFGDIEFGGNAGEHPALNAQFHEALNGFIVVHMILPRVAPRERRSRSATQKPPGHPAAVFCI